MNFTQDQIAAIIGTKELELIALRIEVARLTAQVEELLKRPAPDAG